MSSNQSKKAYRIDKILLSLRKQGAVSIRELSDMLNVTEMTIRRDLQLLSGRKLVKVLHGGVIYVGRDKNAFTSEKVYSYDEELLKNAEAKKKIGERAATLVVPHDTIIIDSGTTTEFFAKNLRDDMPLTVLSYSLNIINVVCSRINFAQIIAGGSFHRNTLSFVGSTGIELIKQLRASKVFVSASGVSDELGVTSTNLYEIELKQAVINSSHTSILLVDSSKFNQVKIAHFADLQDFDIIITDSGVPQEYVDTANALSVEMLIV